MLIVFKLLLRLYETVKKTDRFIHSVNQDLIAPVLLIIVFVNINYKKSQ